MNSNSADLTKYYWMRYASDRATTLHGKNPVRIQKGDLFGVKEIRGKELDEVVLVDGTKLRIAIPASERLMNNAKEFKGKTPVVKPVSPVKVKTLVKPVSPVRVRIPVKSIKPKIILVKKPKAKLTKLVQHKDSDGLVKVKLKHVELPGEDDFTDHELPHEFRRFAKVESSTLHLNEVAKFFSVSSVDVPEGTMQEFNAIVARYLSPCVKLAKEKLEQGIKQAAGKIKAWAIEHMHMAKKLNRRTDLFERLINNPEAASKQLVNNLMMLNTNTPSVKPNYLNLTPKSKQEADIDDLMSAITI